MPTYQQRTINSISGIRALDGHETVPGARFLFVTSERYGDDEPRHYSLRMMTLGTQRDDRPCVDIVTVGDHHVTAAQARAAMRDYDADAPMEL